MKYIGCSLALANAHIKKSPRAQIKELASLNANGTAHKYTQSPAARVTSFSRQKSQLFVLSSSRRRRRPSGEAAFLFFPRRLLSSRAHAEMCLVARARARPVFRCPYGVSRREGAKALFSLSAIVKLLFWTRELLLYPGDGIFAR